MPDKFRILDDSFSGDAPLPEDDGFQNFNALSRFGGEPAIAADRGVEPHSDHEVRLSAGEKASDFPEKPFARQVNSPPFGQKTWASPELTPCLLNLRCPSVLPNALIRTTSQIACHQILIGLVLRATGGRCRFEKCSLFCACPPLRSPKRNNVCVACSNVDLAAPFYLQGAGLE